MARVAGEQTVGDPAEARTNPITEEELPENLRDDGESLAFLRAAHSQGVDVRGILRKVKMGEKPETKGGST